MYDEPEIQSSKEHRGTRAVGHDTLVSVFSPSFPAHVPIEDLAVWLKKRGEQAGVPPSASQD